MWVRYQGSAQQAARVLNILPMSHLDNEPGDSTTANTHCGAEHPCAGAEYGSKQPRGILTCVRQLLCGNFLIINQFSYAWLTAGPGTARDLAQLGTTDASSTAIKTLRKIMSQMQIAER